MTKWLTIIGMGEDGHEGLSARARHALSEAEAVIGSKRLLAMLPDSKAERHEWPQPFSAVINRITAFRGRRTVVLATGDPMNFGAARKLLEKVPFEETEIIPHLSAFSLAAARLGWSIPDCDCLTLHGRDVANIEPFIQPDVRLLVLTADAGTIAAVAARLKERGFGDSLISILENMGGMRENITHMKASELSGASFSDLNTLGIHCRASPDAHLLPRVAGLPDDAFLHDGQITKRETRAVTLAALGPSPEKLLWDVGAGCGSVAIEWMRQARGCEAIAFESNAARIEMMTRNADRLGTPRLRIVAGEAPASLEGHAAPDAVFIGGGLGIPGVFETSWEALKPGGMMVVNVVTVEGELHLYDLQEKHGGELVRIEVSQLAKIGTLRALKPRMPVLQWRARKPW